MEGFEYQEIKEAVKLLMVNPIEEKWQPKNLGICKAQRIDCSHMPNRTYLMCKDKNKNDVLYGYGVRCVYVQIGRVPNTHWLEESGNTYMLWK